MSACNTAPKSEVYKLQTSPLTTSSRVVTERLTNFGTPPLTPGTDTS